MVYQIVCMKLSFFDLIEFNLIAVRKMSIENIKNGKFWGHRIE